MTRLPHRLLWLVAILVGLTATAAAAQVPAGPASQPDPLSASVLQPEAAPGSQVRVIGSGWPSNGIVQTATCGQLAIEGSASCDMRSALATPVRADGTIDLLVTVGTPPVQCPCVLHVTSVGLVTDPLVVDVPFVVTGIAVGETPVRGVAEAQLEVIGTRLRGGGGVGPWFGASTTRTLDYTVRNVGGRALPDTAIEVELVGSGAGRVTNVPTTGPVAPGETRTYNIDVPVPFAAFGGYTVQVAASELAAADADFKVTPWGLILLNLIGVAMIIVGVRRRRGARAVAAQPTAAALGPIPVGDVMILPDVVHVPALGAYLVFADTPAARRVQRQSGGNLDTTSLLRLAGHAPVEAAVTSPLAAVAEPLEAWPDVPPARVATPPTSPPTTPAGSTRQPMSAPLSSPGAQPAAQPSSSSQMATDPRDTGAAVIDLEALNTLLASRTSRGRALLGRSRRG